MQADKPIRRSQLISPWGVGQMINFPNDESLMVAGLDLWELKFRELERAKKLICRKVYYQEVLNIKTRY